MKKIILFMMLFIAILSIKAQTITWIGGNSNWNIPTNWDLNSIPSATNDVIIPTGSTVNILTPSNVRSITVNGTSTINISASFTFSQASQFGSNVITNWSEGNIAGGTLTNAGTINLLTSNFKTILSGTVLNNNGIINFIGTGDLALSSSTLNNLASGVVNFLTDGADIEVFNTVNELFNNSGTINRTTSVGTVRIICNFTNSGTINVLSGTLSLATGANSFNSGVYNVAPNAIFQCEGTTILSGILIGVLNGSFNWVGNFTVPEAATFNFTGLEPLYWISGALNGGGILTNAGNINLSTANPKSIVGGTTLNNNGVVNFAGTGDLALSSSTLNNLVSGVVNFLTDGADIGVFSTVNELFNNAGTINRTASIGTVQITCNFTNSGTINVLSGTFSLPSTGNRFNGGVYNVANTGVFQCGGNIIFSGNLTGVLTGSFNWIGNFIVREEATFNFTGPEPLYWNSGGLLGGGILTNAGNINLSTVNPKVILGGTRLNNNGVINFVGTGDLMLSISTLNNLSSGVVNFLTDGADIGFFSSSTELFNNAGTINRTMSVGTVQISCAFTNSGIINVLTGTLSLTSGRNNFNSGIYNVAPSAIFQCGGTIILSGNLTGVLTGNFNWAGNFSVPATATLNFTGTNSLRWNSGSLTGAGTLTNKGKLLLTTTLNKTISASTTLDNEGSMTLENTGNLILNAATINNLVTGVISLASNTPTIIRLPASTFHIINNYGLLTKIIENGISIIGITFTNFGMIDAALGTIRFDGVLNNTITGIIKGIATIDLPAAANLTNNGIFSPGGTPGKLTVIGDFESTNSSQLDVYLNGLAPVTQYDQLAIQGSAIMKGVVNVVLNFAPIINDEFIIATTTSTITEFTLATQTAAVFNGFSYTFNVSRRNNNEIVLKVTGRVLGIDTNLAIDQKLLLYPNPARNFIILQNESGEEINQAEIIDSSGRIIKNIKYIGTEQNSTIPLEDFSSGHYILKINCGNNIVVKRLIVK